LRFASCLLLWKICGVVRRDPTIDNYKMLQNLYPHLLAFHGALRWIVFAAALAAIFIALSNWRGLKPASGNLMRFSVLFVIAIDIEFLTGLVLYFGASPITRGALANIGEAMKYHEPRFFAIEHTAFMFLAVICAHVGGALARKGRTDLMKYRGAAIAYTISLLCMLSGTPWWRPFLRLGS
jgi:hypothetical protein